MIITVHLSRHIATEMPVIMAEIYLHLMPARVILIAVCHLMKTATICLLTTTVVWRHRSKRHGQVHRQFRFHPALVVIPWTTRCSYTGLTLLEPACHHHRIVDQDP
jgi:hypothetical protein